MRDREEYRQKLCVRDLGRIKSNLDHLGVIGAAAADTVIIRVACIAARIAGSSVFHTFHMLKHCLDAPEAAARKDRRLLAFRRFRIWHGSAGATSLRSAVFPELLAIPQPTAITTSVPNAILVSSDI